MPTDLQNDIILASDNQLIMVDFWADWCGPCKALSPILDKLASEFAGKLTLIKINADDEGELAAQFGVRSLPTLVFVWQRQLVDQVTGAQPEGTLRDRIKALLEHTGAGGSEEVDTEKQIEAADAAILEGRFSEAIPILAAIIQANPADAAARIRLGEALLAMGDTDDANEVIAQVPESERKGNLWLRYETRGNLMGSLADYPENQQQLIEQALSGQGDAALASLLQDAASNEQSRKLMIELFKLFGNGGDLVKRYRQQLMTVLN
ncbi:thioredoxin [Gammaproteobacteria bacterium]|nr:thioredoxin [Gammaproteobacteria bacterium]